MQKKGLIKIVLALSAVFILATSAYAFEIDNTYGLSVRLRQETWDNVFTFQKTGTDDNYLRFKTSIWDRLEVNKQYGVYAKLTNEARYFFSSSNTSRGNRPLGFNKDEIFFDNLYGYVKGIPNVPVELTIGRQDLMYGDYFILVDGTPTDGSRSFYFNAAKGVVKFGEKHSVDLIYIRNQPDENSLPIMFSAPKRNLTAYHEEAVVVYGKTKPLEGLGLEPYYVWKTEFAAQSGTTFDPNNVLRLNTFGMRYTYTVGSGWKGLISHGEYAHQFGAYSKGAKREADGGFVYVGQKYDTLMFKPFWEVGYIYLSGDKPNSPDMDRGWDPLFSRGPWISELYALSLARESNIVGYWSNLQAARAAMKFAVTPATMLDLSYVYMRADECRPASGIFSQEGLERGQLITAKLAHKFSQSVDGYVMIEGFKPGNFYAPANRHDATFVRWELQWKI